MQNSFFVVRRLAEEECDSCDRARVDEMFFVDHEVTAKSIVDALTTEFKAAAQVDWHRHAVNDGENAIHCDNYKELIDAALVLDKAYFAENPIESFFSASYDYVEVKRFIPVVK